MPVGGEFLGRDVACAVGDLATARAPHQHDLEQLKIALAAWDHGEALDVEHRLKERVEVLLEAVTFDAKRAEEVHLAAARAASDQFLGVEGEALASHLLRPLDEIEDLHAFAVHREGDGVGAFVYHHARLARLGRRCLLGGRAWRQAEQQQGQARKNLRGKPLAGKERGLRRVDSLGTRTGVVVEHHRVWLRTRGNPWHALRVRTATARPIFHDVVPTGLAAPRRTPIRARRWS